MYLLYLSYCITHETGEKGLARKLYIRKKQWE